MVGNLNQVFCARVGTRTAKTRSFICWQSDRRLIQSHRLHGTRCGAIVIDTKATAISQRSACHCSCINTRTHGSTFEIDVSQQAIVSITFKTQLRPHLLIARSASISGTTSLTSDQTSGVSPHLTARKVILRGVAHHEILTSTEPSCLQRQVAR